MFDLVSIGDVALDHFCKISDAHVEKGSNRQLCLDFGSKLPVEEYHQTLGGNNGNNVVGAVRLGLKTTGYFNVGSDPAGKQIIDGLKMEGVDIRYVVVNPGMTSNTSVLISYEGERTILVYHQPWRYQLPDLDRTKWIYLSSLSRSFVETNIMDQVARFVERTGARLVFNPGDYQLEYGVKRFPKLLSLTTLLVVNKEEAEHILKMERKRSDFKKLLRGLSGLGPRTVIVTDGEDGSFGFDGESFFKMEIFPAKVVDMTGAGDGYTIGVLAGLFYGKDLPEAMRWGAANGASVVERVGAQAGLLTYDQMRGKLKENKQVIVQSI